MSRYNQCKECIKNENDWCTLLKKKIDYLMDTSECEGFKRKTGE